MSASLKEGVIKITGIEALEVYPDFPEGAIKEGSRGQKGATVFEDGNCTVGIWSSLPNKTNPLKFSYAEYMVILEGEVQIAHQLSGLTDSFKEGATFLIPAGMPFFWNQPSEIKKIYFVVEDISIDSHADEFKPINTLSTSSRVEKISNRTYHIVYQDKAAKFSAGKLLVSSLSTPLSHRQQHELITPINGSISIIYQKDSQQHVEHIHPGQSVFITAGTLVSITAKADEVTCSFAAA